jgi:hypothetical protein
MTELFFAIAATIRQRGIAHSRFRAELVFTLAEDADAALGALRSQVAKHRPGWEIVSTAIRVVPTPPLPEVPAEGESCTS